MFRKSLVFLLIMFIQTAAQQLPQMRVIDTPRLLRNEFVGARHRDVNDRIAAAIKVVSDMEGFSYQSNNGIVEVERAPGVDMVYLQPDERVLEIYKSGYEPLKVILSDYSIRLQSRQVWELKVTGEKKPVNVTILSDPPDAEKILDGKSLGTGETFIIIPGGHELRLRKQGYKDLVRNITVDEGQTLFKDLVLQEIDIVPVQIKSEPKGATVFIDAVKKGKTDLPLWLYPGDYQLKLSLSGYLDSDKKITVKEGSSNTFTEKLVKNAAYLQVTVKPVDAILILNDKEYTPGTIELIPGTYELSVVKSGYLSQQETLNLVLGETINRTYNLVKNVGYLNLTTNPQDATLLINRQHYGTQRSIELSPGTYKIEVEKDGWYGETETVTIALGESISKTYNLKQMTGSLQFSIQPLEAQVRMIDARGSVYQSWPGMQYLKEIPVGTYTLECKADKHKTLKKEIVITENVTEIQSLQMEEGSDFVSGVEMVFVKGGTFQMGDKHFLLAILFGEELYGDEEPVHGVTVSDFYISKYEVTYEQFEEFIDSTNYKTTAEEQGYSRVYNGSWETKDGIHWRHDVSGNLRRANESKHPVIHVSWYDAPIVPFYVSGHVYQDPSPALMVAHGLQHPL